MKKFNPNEIKLTKYLFFTGKGGVGKTSTACSTAVTLADQGKKVLLVSTDPASNLQDVFETEFTNKPKSIEGIPNLTVANLDPVTSAKEYRDGIISPLRGKLPQAVIDNMEEQLSGSCTVEISAFNEFSHFLTDKKAKDEYDFIIFDTAPTGHTLRLLQLPSAWNNFLDENTHGASCLGQLSGLEDKKELYKMAVESLSDPKLTTLILVARPDDSPLKEAKRASRELLELGVNNQILLINGLLNEFDDKVSESIFKKQKTALENLPESFDKIEKYYIPLRGYNITGIENVRSFLTTDKEVINTDEVLIKEIPQLKDVVENLYNSGRKVIFTMGKGGVGKTTIAAAIALGLSKKGKKVHLTTTDPAAHINYVLDEDENISISHIDEVEELEKYKAEVLLQAKETMSGDDLAYIKEDLESPCTQEIAVFRAFAEIIERAENEVVVVDTAPTGHTLLLLDSTNSYNKEIQRSKGNIPLSATKLLPRLKNEKETEVIIVTLPEATPVYEALRLEEDLKRAQIKVNWWIINSSLYKADSKNRVLASKASNEIEWINKINTHTNGQFALIPWNHDELKNESLLSM